jgi:hypothetical protein
VLDLKPSDSFVQVQTCYRYVRSRHAPIISRIAYNSYLQLKTIRYYLQQGCARMPVGTHPYLFVVSARDPIAVPCMALLRARRGNNRRLRSADQQLSGSHIMEGFQKYYLYTGVKISRSASPIFLFEARYSSNTLMSTCGTNCIRGVIWRRRGDGLI